MKTHKFWPLDYDPEGEIYENVSWDLPGFRGNRRGSVSCLSSIGRSRHRRTED